MIRLLPILALALTGCVDRAIPDGAGDASQPVSKPVVEQVGDVLAEAGTAVNRVCDSADLLKPIIQVEVEIPDQVGRYSELICALSRGLTPAPSFADGRSTLQACNDTTYYAKTEEFERDWQAVCPPLVNGTTTAIRTINSAVAMYKEVSGGECFAPDVFFFEGDAASPSGRLTVAVYSPANRRVMVDRKALKRFHPNKDVRDFVVIAHEFGHAYHDCLGLLFKYGIGDLEYDRDIEGSGDCLTGVQATFAGFENRLIAQADELFIEIGGPEGSTHPVGHDRRDMWRKGISGTVEDCLDGLV